MSFLPLSYSTTSLSTTDSGCFTDLSDSTGYTSDGRRDSSHCVKGRSCAGGGGDEHASAGEEDQMRLFLLGPGWYDHRVPPAERLKHLYHLLEEHYDLTGGDYHGRGTSHVCRTPSASRRAVQLRGFPVTCVSYLASIGVDPGFLMDSNHISPDPMADLIEEAFCSSVSQFPKYKYRTTPVSTWEIDWGMPLPKAPHAYWEIMRHTRPKPVHEFTRAKPVADGPRATPRPRFRQDLPQYHCVEEKGNSTNRFRAALHRLRGFATPR